MSGRDSYLPKASASLSQADFPARVASQGMRGAVVTAVCPQGRALYATAFGRAGDTNTYDTRVVTSAFDALATELGAMAAEGFFITALGRDGTGTGGRGGFVVVGTRVNGRSGPRSFKLIDVPSIVNDPRDRKREALEALFTEGYAIVGEIFHGGGCGTGSWLYVAER